MAYQCQDCSHKSRKMPQGECPACGSRNIRNLNKVNLGDSEAPKRSPWRLVVLVALWAYLAYALVDKLSA
jgi:predicted ATP-dependent serine protease